MTRPFLIIQLRPEDEISDNEFEKIRYYGELQNHEVERFRIEKFKLPDMDLGRYSGVIVGGSPFDLSTPSRDKSALQQRIEADFRSLFDVLVAEDFPFLGCCSGSGLLGSYCGVRISTRFGEAVSGVDVTITEAGRHDPLLKGMPKFIRVLLGHKEACDELPPEASLLIEGKECPVQMFRLKSNIYATQFHPEGDPEGFAVRINAYKHHGYFAP
ncbi:MAG: glutamine amidotransferase, partial [Gammaproteobacteria bacterium]|nr:glutamine amidotransferase [Gammaproteobacteria bacterium]